MKASIPPVLIAFSLACFALSPRAQAVSPPPDGGYPGENTAEGTHALFSLTTGEFNTALGWLALQSNTGAWYNTAVGAGALFSNRGEGQNTATGAGALFNNFGANNAANGAFALYTNGLGSGNTAMGSNALHSNRTAFANTAIGYGALFNNTGEDFALGAGNTAIGFEALYNNTTGNSNIALGGYAGWNRTTGDFNIDIGNEGVAGEANTIRIGIGGLHTRAFISGISGVAVTGSTVVVDADGQLGVAPSSARFKDNIKPMDNTSEAILALQPVTFHYKKELDPAGIPRFGLVAEEVDKVYPDLVARDDQGKPYGVRYEAVNAMFLNEFLKEHRTVQEQGATIAQQQKQIEALTAGLQKVNAQLELNQRAQETVSNNH